MTVLLSYRLVQWDWKEYFLVIMIENNSIITVGEGLHNVACRTLFSFKMLLKNPLDFTHFLCMS